MSTRKPAILMTSLAEIYSFNPCAYGWKDVLKSRPAEEQDDRTIRFPLIECVTTNSFSDVCWLLGKRKVELQIVVSAARKCANSVKHLRNAAHAADAAAYATYAADAADAAAAYAANAAAYADAADAAAAADADAADAADAAAYAAAYAANARSEQYLKNKQFLRECIIAFEYGEI